MLPRCRLAAEEWSHAHIHAAIEHTYRRYRDPEISYAPFVYHKGTSENGFPAQSVGTGRMIRSSRLVTGLRHVSCVSPWHLLVAISVLIVYWAYSTIIPRGAIGYTGTGVQSFLAIIWLLVDRSPLYLIKPRRRRESKAPWDYTSAKATPAKRHDYAPFGTIKSTIAPAVRR